MWEALGKAILNKGSGMNRRDGVGSWNVYDVLGGG